MTATLTTAQVQKIKESTKTSQEAMQLQMLIQPQLKDMTIAYMLGAIFWITGISGIHRMYNGQIALGILQLVTLGGFGFWALLDVVLTKSLVEATNDGIVDQTILQHKILHDHGTN